jgi:hypothetical protein
MVVRAYVWWLELTRPPEYLVHPFKPHRGHCTRHNKPDEPLHSRTRNKLDREADNDIKDAKLLAFNHRNTRNRYGVLIWSSLTPLVSLDYWASSVEDSLVQSPRVAKKVVPGTSNVIISH